MKEIQIVNPKRDANAHSTHATMAAIISDLRMENADLKEENRRLHAQINELLGHEPECSPVRGAVSSLGETTGKSKSLTP